MCGIAGRVSLDNRDLDVAPLADMMDIVEHRGPDGQGFAVFDVQGGHPQTGSDSGILRNASWPNIRVALGHRRLAIIDLRDVANQPMSYDSGRLWVVFNGEIYNYLELRDELQSEGFVFRTASDTEVILAAYQHWGVDCVDRFNGMFAIAIYDRPNRRLVCFRDRLGIKPFYYAMYDGVFAFGSEIKQLLQAETRRKVNPQRVFDYLIVGSTDHHTETCFEGVWQLLPSHRLTIDLAAAKAKIHFDKYWEPKRDAALAQLSNESAAQRVRELLFDSVKLRMRSDVPLGSCLSGGLDSSSIVTLMAQIRQQQGLEFAQHTFTYQPDDVRIDESRYADIVSHQVGATRHIAHVDPDDMLQSLDHHLWHEEEPIADLSHFARAQVMALARKSGVTVVLDGQGGDELFLGYERYYVPAFLRFRKELGLSKAIREFRLSSRNSKVSTPKMLVYSLLFGNSRIRAMFFRRRAKGWINERFLNQHDVVAVARAHHLSTDIWAMQRRDLLEIQLPHLLRHEDRDSMASSIEARTPLLDHRLVELVMSLGVHTKIHNGWTKYCLRMAMNGILPKEIQWRRDKLGFAVPQARWVAKLEAHVRDQLTGDLACESFVDRDKLRRGIRQGRFRPNTLWWIMSLEKTMRIFSLDA